MHFKSLSWISTLLHNLPHNFLDSFTNLDDRLYWFCLMMRQLNHPEVASEAS